jgi:hypothetical protein
MLHLKGPNGSTGSFDPAIVHPVKKAATLSLIIIDRCIPPLEVNENPGVSISTPGGYTTMGFIQENLDTKRVNDACINYIYSKILLELARAVRESMDNAYVYLQFYSSNRTFKTVSQAHQMHQTHRTRAQKMDAKKLANKIQKLCGKPFDYLAELESLKRVRNCLEHRNGIIGDEDINEDGIMELAYPGIQFFAKSKKTNEEVLLRTNDDQVSFAIYDEKTNSFKLQEDAKIWVKYSKFSKNFVRGNAVSFSCNEMIDVCHGCIFLAGDIEDKMPGDFVRTPLMNVSKTGDAKSRHK